MPPKSLHETKSVTISNQKLKFLSVLFHGSGGVYKVYENIKRVIL